MISELAGGFFITSVTWEAQDYTVKVTSRFKGLDLIDRVPEELWTEIHNIVKGVETKIIP